MGDVNPTEPRHASHVPRSTSAHDQLYVGFPIPAPEEEQRLRAMIRELQEEREPAAAR